MPRRTRSVVVVAVLLAVASTRASTPPRSITTPSQQFGAAIGDDYFLATYTQLEAYWKRLDLESDRVSLVDIGRTEEGRTQWMAVITAPENFARLERYKSVSRRLARAEGLDEAEARLLAAEGKAVVLLAGGLHATEVLGAQQLIQTAYVLVSGTDAETRRILRDVIVLVVDANPDGHELVANWYMRHRNPRDRTLAGVPRLSQKYAGHDNNRDFYIATQAETINLSRVLYKEWVPQIVYDHHQAPMDDAVMYAPPFSGPSNYLLDSRVADGVQQFGQAIRARFEAEGKGGIATSSAPYSMWWNGGLRTTAYFHNQIGLLAETAGSPTPLRGVGARTWRFRQSVEYSVTANLAVLDLASRHREKWLLDIYRMGRASIDRGSRDWWTPTPHRRQGGAPDPRLRDARAYVIPADQADFPTAVRFVNALLRAGIAVHRATSPFTADGRSHPAGSYVVKTAQAFRPHVLDMFEPQDHPDDILSGGPRAPYDIAGWTLAFQMGVQFVRVLNGFEGPFESVSGTVRPPHGEVATSADTRGYLFSHRQNDAAVVLNRLLRAGQPVSWSREGMYVRSTAGAEEILRRAARDLGLTFRGVPEQPSDARRLKRARIGLIDRYGGWSTSGWIRWILERHEFPFEVVYPPTLDRGGLSARFDVLIVPDEATPNHGGSWKDMDTPDGAGPEYQASIGEITVRNTAPALSRFVEEGGTLLAMGSASWLARALGLPISEPLAQMPRDQYFIPGSVLRVSVDNATPLGYGFDDHVDVFFHHSPVFRVFTGAEHAARLHPVAIFDSPRPLRSGWALGQARLHGTAAIVDAQVGAGRVVLLGPEIVFRGQAHGTFRFLFNAIYAGSTDGARPTPPHRPFS